MIRPILGAGVGFGLRKGDPLLADAERRDRGDPRRWHL